MFPARNGFCSCRAGRNKPANNSLFYLLDRVNAKLTKQNKYQRGLLWLDCVYDHESLTQMNEHFVLLETDCIPQTRATMKNHSATEWEIVTS